MEPPNSCKSFYHPTSRLPHTFPRIMHLLLGRMLCQQTPLSLATWNIRSPGTYPSFNSTWTPSSLVMLTKPPIPVSLGLALMSPELGLMHSQSPTWASVCQMMQFAQPLVCRLEPPSAYHTLVACHAVHPVDEFGHHGLSCKFGKGRTPCHYMLNTIIHHSLASANIPSRLEPSNLYRADGKHPDGVTMAPWSNGRLVWTKFLQINDMADYTDLLQDVSYHSSRNLYIPRLRQTICEYFLRCCWIPLLVIENLLLLLHCQVNFRMLCCYFALH